MAGGSIQSIQLNGRTFSVAADADTNKKLGGYENDVQANGDGTARLIKTMVPWKHDGLVLSINDARGDAEFLQDLQNLTDLFPIVVTYADLTSYSGLGQLTGETQVATMASTATVTLMGSGTWRKL